MNNLKKIGLSALAGSLVAFSANAVEMSVSGTAEITYATIKGDGTAGVTTGSPWGSNTSLKFSGSGNVGWADVTLVRQINDKMSAYLSAWQTMDMGDLGTISFDGHGGGLEGVTAYDDKLPSAYEEIWNGVSTSGVSGAASNDTLGYANSFGPVSISLAHTKGGTAGSGDGNVAQEDGQSITDGSIKIDASMLIDGLSIQAATSTTDDKQPTATDTTSNVGHVLYSSGPVSVGYRVAEHQPGNGSTIETGKNVEAYSAAFAVNDALSISYGEQETEYDIASNANNITEEVSAMNVSYTVGAASVRGTMSESSNDGGVQSNEVEMMEISLVLAF
jgi:outer membrane protein OmpU